MKRTVLSATAILVFLTCIGFAQNSSDGAGSNDTSPSSGSTPTQPAVDLQQLMRTRDYWTSINQILVDGPDLSQWTTVHQHLEKLLADGKLDEIVKLYDEESDKFVQFAKRIRLLKKVGVDSDLVKHGLKIAEWFCACAEYDRKISNAFTEVKKFNEKHTFWNGVKEGLGGTNLDELKAKTTAEREGILRQLTELSQGGHTLEATWTELETARAALGAKLTKRYGVDF